MSDFSASPVASPRRVSTIAVLAVFLIVTVLITVAAAVLYLILDAVTGVSTSGAAMAGVIPMVAAMTTGGFWAKREGRPSSGRQWFVALLAAILTVVLNLAVAWFAIRGGFVPELRSQVAMSTEDMQILVIVGAAFALMFLLLIRLGFWTGINGWEKRNKSLQDKLRK
ncbi:hypothetical protein HOY34_02735 [Xinfangfangia sp. D13-10-4-6]|uniref:ABZJ_00895 family protein n=1 Tax=Pseudogemmobacter hezensis TaxID=2737662 RepID=UPI0015561779|nr:ABZJ_00895 family protein [Pseudogemmobacter hezensis]NPD14113.1 hypothetical protein [Pseudogemmobacter hezensis]